MSKGKLNKIISGFAFAFALAFGMLLMTGTSVSAQSRDRDYRDNGQVFGQRDRDGDDQNWRGDRNGNDRAVRQAYQNGFQAGQQQAMRELNSRRNRGWGNSGYGNYSGGYGNFGGFGRNGQVRQAYQSGFNAGYQQTMGRYQNTRSRNGGRWPF